MTLAEGFKSIMVIFALGTFLFLLFKQLLGTVIDPELPGKMFDITVDKLVDALESMNMDDDEIAKSMEGMDQMRDNIAQSYTIKGFITSYFLSVVFGAIGALIGAGITKKEDTDPRGNLKSID